MKRILYIITLFFLFLACTDDIDKSNRYTFTGETIADYLLNHSDKYSHFIHLLERANLLSLLSTYGQYTLFLPDNESVEKFIVEQDSIYRKYKDTETYVWTGITSPFIEDLSDSMANIIARTHLIEASTMMAEMGEGALSERNFNYRFIGVNFVVENEMFYIKLNNSAAIVGGDNQMENGVVHLIDKVIVPSQDNVPELIGTYEFFNIFTIALNRTGFGDSLKRYDDKTYNPDKYGKVDEASGAYIYAPETRYYKYTGFIETDEVFHANGIYTIDDLVAFAEKWYGKEDKDNFKSPKNALYKFVAYHFVPRELPHNKIVPYNINSGNFKFDAYMPPIYDRYDYFETMQGTLMKVMKPLGRPEGGDTYINFNKRESPYNTDMHNHLNVRVIPLTEFITMDEKYECFDQMACNGILHPIDKILIYNENEMFGNILNERIRIDFYSLIPELSCNNVRYNTYKMYYIPDIYSEKLHIKDGELCLLTTGMASHYNVDNFVLCGLFDVEFTLPPLPPRVYEIRLGFGNAQVSLKQQVQVYIDGKPAGIPFDANYKNTDRVEDIDTYDNGVENDKAMRNLGWMKAPIIFNDFLGVSARHSTCSIRKIITKCYLDAGQHKIRFRLLGDYKKELGIDFLEFVPLRILSDPIKPEDRY